MKKIALMVDSASDISLEEEKELDLHVVRMPISIDGKEYIAEEEISLPEFVEKMGDGAICKTSQPPIGKIIEMYDNLLKEYDEVIYLPMSSKLSGTYATAAGIAKNYDGKVTVIDSLHVCYVNIMLVHEVRKMLANGLTSAQVKEKVENEATMWACLLPDDLVYLKRGGRISAMAAALGNLLKIVPILKVEDGAIDVFDKVRTKKKAISVALDGVTQDVAVNDYYWLVLHADAQEVAQEVAQELKERTGQPVVVHTIGQVIMSHTGPKTIGLGRMKKIA